MTQWCQHTVKVKHKKVYKKKKLGEFSNGLKILDMWVSKKNVSHVLIEDHVDGKLFEKIY